MNIFEWIEQELAPDVCDSVEFMYDDMESQSGHNLPVIYKPFNPHDKAHWRDRGACYDYLYSTNGQGKRLLDFGPGDGWPCLIVAPFVREVIGVDGSTRRVKTCTENAKRLNITNTMFMHVEPGKRLPFEDKTFDGAMAASSIEQTPDPEFTLSELHRILKSGGRLRMHYESLGYYADGKEQEVFLDEVSDNLSTLTIYDRHIPEEFARMYKIFIAMSTKDLKQHFQGLNKNLIIAMITKEKLARVQSNITESRMCTLHHPSGKTFISWLEKTGFTEVSATQDGAGAAEGLFDKLTEKNRPHSISEIDELIKPVVKEIIQMPAPLNRRKAWDPMIIAIK